MAEVWEGEDFSNHFWNNLVEHLLIISLILLFPCLAYFLHLVIKIKEVGIRNQELEIKMEERTQELADFRSFSESIMGSVNDMIFAIGSDGRFRFVTGNSKQVLGFEPEHLEGLQFVDLIAEGSVAVAVGNFERIMWGEPVPSYELEMLDAAGNTRAVEITSAPYRDDSRVVAQVGVAREVSDRKQLQIHINNSRRQMGVLNSIAVAAGNNTDHMRVLNGALEQMVSLLGADRAWINVYDDECDELVLHAWKGARADSEMIRRALTCRLGEGFTGTVASERKSKTVNIVDLISELAVPLRQLDTESLAAVPMLASGRLVGVLCVASSDPDNFSLSDIDLMEVVASQIATVVEYTMPGRREYLKANA